MTPAGPAPPERTHNGHEIHRRRRVRRARPSGDAGSGGQPIAGRGHEGYQPQGGAGRGILGNAAGSALYLGLEALIERSDPVVEAAGPAIVPELAGRCFAAGKGLLVISIGALLDRPDLLELARERNCRLILPSGALAGIDGVKAACRGSVERVLITTRKPPRAWPGRRTWCNMA